MALVTRRHVVCRNQVQAQARKKGAATRAQLLAALGSKLRGEFGFDLLSFVRLDSTRRGRAAGSGLHRSAVSAANR